jgi:hypothetical protein
MSINKSSNLNAIPADDTSFECKTIDTAEHVNVKPSSIGIRHMPISLEEKNLLTNLTLTAERFHSNHLQQYRRMSEMLNEKGLEHMVRHECLLMDAVTVRDELVNGTIRSLSQSQAYMLIGMLRKEAKYNHNQEKYLQNIEQLLNDNGLTKMNIHRHIAEMSEDLIDRIENNVKANKVGGAK